MMTDPRLTTRNPAPDATPSRQPTGAYVVLAAADAAVPLAETPAGIAVLKVVAEWFVKMPCGDHEYLAENLAMCRIAASLGKRPVVRDGVVEFEAL